MLLKAPSGSIMLPFPKWSLMLLLLLLLLLLLKSENPTPGPPNPPPRSPPTPTPGPSSPPPRSPPTPTPGPPSPPPRSPPTPTPGPPSPPPTPSPTSICISLLWGTGSTGSNSTMPSTNNPASIKLIYKFQTVSPKIYYALSPGCFGCCPFDFGCSVVADSLYIVAYIVCFACWIWFLTSHQQSFSYIRTGLSGLNQY